MGKKIWGGYFPDQYPLGQEPSSARGVIPGVFYADDVRLFLDQEDYTSTMDENRTIYATYALLNGLYSSWPRSLFSVTTGYPLDASVQCNTNFIDFEARATAGAVDYRYGFKMYWETQLAGTTEWVPITSPTYLITTKLRIGNALYTDSEYQNPKGQYSILRYSSINRYSTGATITIPPSNNTVDNDTIALMLFNATSSGNVVGPVVAGTGLPTPTISRQGSPELTTVNPPAGQQRSLEITSQQQSVTLTANSFSRNDGDFTIELYFLWKENTYNYTTYDTTLGTIIDTRMASADVKLAKNPDAFAIQIRNGRLTVLRGEAPVIVDAEPFPTNMWYHIILTCENRVWRLYKRPLPTGGGPAQPTATRVGVYAGEHVPVLRLRGTDLEVSKNGTKYRALVKYGALRSKYSDDATLEVVTPEITEWIIQIDLLLVGGADISNQRHLLADQGTGYPPAAGHEVRLDVEIESTVASNQFMFGWEIATQILSDTLDPERESFFIGSPAPDGGGYSPQQVYDWIAGEALAVAEGLTPEEYWAGATTTNPAVPVVPELEWTTRRAPQSNPEVPPFVIESFFDKNFLAYRPYAMCGTQRITGPVAFIQKATT